MTTKSSTITLHNAEVELQALITRRLAMVAANHAAEVRGDPMPFHEEDFNALAAEMRQACWVDPETAK